MLGKSTKVALVALPWAAHNRPSAALGALLAQLKSDFPRLKVTALNAFLDVWAELPQTYELIADESFTLGESLYAALLYPAQAPHVAARYGRWVTERSLDAPLAFEVLQATLSTHLDRLATTLRSVAVVGMTTCFGQLFANLVLARRLKALSPETRIVLGGSTLSQRVGPSVLAEFPEVDYIVQGEGERPLSAVVRALLAGETGAIAGVLQRGSGEAPAELVEVAQLDDLPLPDFADYPARAEALQIDWVLPIEGSRGCWWDRSKKGGPKATCYFCNLNVQWNGYRQKSAPRIGRELAELSVRHRRLKIFFLDNIIRAKGIDELAARISAVGREFDIFYEVRANCRPYELMRMWEAGLGAVQLGVESLSSAYLKRIGKGTRTIQNLEAMKTCFELGIENFANLITHFPGATSEEVDESARNIGVALAYQPLAVSKFSLGVGATLDVLRREYGIANVRNDDDYKLALPGDVYDRLRLFELSFDCTGPQADWGPVLAARERWVAAHASRERLLEYRDGGEFLVIADRRGPRRDLELEDSSRAVYLFCLEIRSFREVAAEFPEFDSEALRAFLDECVATGFMFQEGVHYLSLATAASPVIAAKRIRQAHEARPLAGQRRPLAILR